ncbi:hypothetical protein JCM10213v2_005179 [Rhodosporidiobolus nylandii]
MEQNARDAYAYLEALSGASVAYGHGLLWLDILPSGYPGDDAQGGMDYRLLRPLRNSFVWLLSFWSPAGPLLLLGFVLGPFVLFHPFLIIFIIFLPFAFIGAVATRLTMPSTLPRTSSPLYVQVTVSRVVWAVQRYEDARHQHEKSKQLLSQELDAATPERELFWRALEDVAERLCAICWGRRTDRGDEDLFLLNAGSLPLVRDGPLIHRTSFRLGLHALLSQYTPLRLPSGAALILSPDLRHLVLRDIETTFALGCQDPITLPGGEPRLPAAYMYSILVLFIAVCRRLLLLLAAIRPSFAPRVHIAFPNLTRAIQHDVLSSPSLFAERCLGLRRRAFDPFEDRILPTSGSSISARLNVAPGVFREHYTRAYAKVYAEEDLRRREEEIEKDVLDAVLAWKEARLEREQDEVEAEADEAEALLAGQRGEEWEV